MKRPTTHRTFRTRWLAARGNRLHRQGGAVLEAALVLSLMIMLSLGAAEFGYAFFLKHALLQATSAGLRQAILPSSTDAAVQSAVSNQLSMTGMQNIQYTLTTVPSSVTGCNNGTAVTVTLSCTWGNVGISPLPTSLGGFGSTKQFSATATMIHE
jgi:Flp pilus assembly protein TadG